MYHNASKNQKRQFDRTYAMSQLDWINVDGEHRLAIGEKFSRALYLEMIAEVAQDLAATRKSHCRAGRQPYQRIGYQLNERIVDALLLPAREMFGQIPCHTFHPYIALFMECAIATGLHECVERPGYTIFDQVEYQRKRADFLTMLRSRRCERPFCKALKAHKDRYRFSTKTVEQYTDERFVNYRRLLVLRVDLFFCKDNYAARNWEAAQFHRERLIKYLNTDYVKLIQSDQSKLDRLAPEPLAGYIVGTEYGPDVGWHFHVTVFLSGRHFWKDAHLAYLLCNAWRISLMSETGYAHNCNEFKENYPKLGIGPVLRTDMAKREVLKTQVAAYATKGCYFAAAQTGPKSKLINMGPGRSKRVGAARRREGIGRTALNKIYSPKTNRWHDLLPGLEE